MSRVSQVAEQIGAAICTGRLRPGESLTAEDVQSQTGTSRSGVREALGILMSLGLLRVRRRVGYEVCDIQHWQHLAPEVTRWRFAGPDAEPLAAELAALRAAIEPAAAAAAARLATAPQRAEIAAAASQIWTSALAGDREGFLEADVRMHAAILAASGNRLFASLGGLLAESLPPRAPDADSISGAEATAHLDLAAAISAADDEKAERLLREIITRTA